MCGFFSFSTGMSARELAELLGVTNLPSREEDLTDLQSLKFYPRSMIPTVSKNSPNRLVKRYWWLIPRWWKDDPYKVKFATFNARMEDVRTKSTFRTPWRLGQRCLIPATWFYEFRAVKDAGKMKPKKVPYRVQVKGEEVIGLAGLYEIWRDAGKRPIESVAIITCPAIEPLVKIHDRQPVIVERKDWETWLSRKTLPEKAYQLLRPKKGLEVFEIDGRFNRVYGNEVTEEMVAGVGKPLG